MSGFPPRVAFTTTLRRTRIDSYWRQFGNSRQCARVALVFGADIDDGMDDLYGGGGLSGMAAALGLLALVVRPASPARRRRATEALARPGIASRSPVVIPIRRRSRSRSRWASSSCTWWTRTGSADPASRRTRGAAGHLLEGRALRQHLAFTHHWEDQGSVSRRGFRLDLVAIGFSIPVVSEPARFAVELIRASSGRRRCSRPRTAGERSLLRIESGFALGLSRLTAPVRVARAAVGGLPLSGYDPGRIDERLLLHLVAGGDDRPRIPTVAGDHGRRRAGAGGGAHGAVPAGAGSGALGRLNDEGARAAAPGGPGGRGGGRTGAGAVRAPAGAGRARSRWRAGCWPGPRAAAGRPAGARSRRRARCCAADGGPPLRLAAGRRGARPPTATPATRTACRSRSTTCATWRSSSPPSTTAGQVGFFRAVARAFADRRRSPRWRPASMPPGAPTATTSSPT